LLETIYTYPPELIIESKKIFSAALSRIGHPELVSGSFKAGSFNFTCILLKAKTLKDAEINSA